MTDIEIWRTAVYDGELYEGLYKVSNWGRILSLNYRNTGKPGLMNPFDNGYGYLKVKLYKNKERKNCLVHRLIAETFLENPEEKPEVNHKDENKTNNFVFLNEDGSVDKEKSNLEWCDRKYNNNYGTHNERISKANINGKQSKRVLQFSKSGDFIREWESSMEIYRQLGYCNSFIGKCCKGKYESAYGFKWEYK